MLKIFRKDSLTPQTERIYKVPLFHRLGSCLIPLDATERLRALHSYYRMGDEASFSFNWNEYLHLKRDWRNDIINTSFAGASGIFGNGGWKLRLCDVYQKISERFDGSILK